MRSRKKEEILDENILLEEQENEEKLEVNTKKREKEEINITNVVYEKFREYINEGGFYTICEYLTVDKLERYLQKF